MAESDILDPAVDPTVRPDPDLAEALRRVGTAGWLGFLGMAVLPIGAGLGAIRIVALLPLVRSHTVTRRLGAALVATGATLALGVLADATFGGRGVGWATGEMQGGSITMVAPLAVLLIYSWAMVALAEERGWHGVARRYRRSLALLAGGPAACIVGVAWALAAGWVHHGHAAVTSGVTISLGRATYVVNGPAGWFVGASIVLDIVGLFHVVGSYHWLQRAVAEGREPVTPRAVAPPTLGADRVASLIDRLADRGTTRVG